MIAGLGGVGKSTLANRLLGLVQEENIAKEGCRGKATTDTVVCHKCTLKNGEEAIIFDTPGFNNQNIKEHHLIPDIKLKTEMKLDLMLYCISIEGRSAQVNQEDIRAIHLLTNVFRDSLWKKAIFVMTFANVAGKRMKKPKYIELKQKIKEDLHNLLLYKAHVPMHTILQIPVTTAGHIDPVIPHEQEDWIERLFRLFRDKMCTGAYH